MPSGRPHHQAWQMLSKPFGHCTTSDTESLSEAALITRGIQCSIRLPLVVATHIGTVAAAAALLPLETAVCRAATRGGGPTSWVCRNGGP